jgi:RHS repeat-associated protein
VVGTWSFDPHGRVTASTGTATTAFGFAGEWTDAESGFVYLRARYYDPATGQFLTRDPVTAATRSPHAYVNGNPLNATDPTGLYAACGTQIDDGAWNSWTAETRQQVVDGACKQQAPQGTWGSDTGAWAHQGTIAAPRPTGGGTCEGICKAAEVLGPPVPPTPAGVTSFGVGLLAGYCIPALNVPSWLLMGFSGLLYVGLSYDDPPPGSSAFSGRNDVMENGIPYW